MRVHSSNYRIVGFTKTPSLSELADLAHTSKLLLYEDAGSGALIDLTSYGIEGEPVIRKSIDDGADIVTFSGDKLLGGPQAGLIVGRADLVKRLRRDPLARAMRPDKVTLAALAATLALYRAGRAVETIPVWRMIAAPVAEIRRRTEAVA